MDNTELILKNKSILKAMIIIAIPIFFSNFLKALHDVVDTFFINKELPEIIATQGIAAIGVAWPVIATVIGLGLGLSIAGVALISQHVGNKNFEEGRNYASKLFFISVIAGIVLNILLYFMAPLILKMMGVTGDTFVYARDYMQIRSFEIPFLFAFSIYQAIRQSEGDTLSPMVYNIIMIILNIVLTPILIKNAGLGINGAALGTLIAQIVVMPGVIFSVFNKKNKIHVEWKNFKLDYVISMKIVKIASYSAAGQALSNLGFVFINALIISYGDNVASAFGVGNRISSFFVMPANALGAVLASFIGQNIGANQIERAKKSYKISRNATFILLSVLALVVIPIRGVFSKILAPGPIIPMVDEYVMFLLLTQPFMALFTSYTGLFDGTGNTKYSLVMQITRLWVLRIPIVLFFKYCTDFGPEGIWYAMVISNCLIIFVGMFFYRKVHYERIV